MARTLWLAVALLLGAGPVLAQSLGDVAKKERERREKNKVEGKAAREFTEEEVFGPEDEAETDEVTGRDVDADAELDGNDALSAPGESSGTDDWEEQSRERRRSESEWRARVQSARARIETARARRQALDGLNLTVGEQYVDANGNPVIYDLDHLKRLVGEANAELAAAERALADLLEEARREGVPPGWLRPR